MSSVEAVNRCLVPQGSLDLLGYNVRPEDLALSALDALYPDHPVCASTDITGRDGKWTLELLVQEGGRVSLGHTRSLAHLYFTSAAYDLDVQLFPMQSIAPGLDFTDPTLRNFYAWMQSLLDEQARVAPAAPAATAEAAESERDEAEHLPDVQLPRPIRRHRPATAPTTTTAAGKAVAVATHSNRRRAQ